jgi:predicted nucleotide-binding protein
MGFQRRKGGQSRLASAEPDMSITREEYDYRTSQLQYLDFEDATSRLIGFLEWLQTDQEANELLDALRKRDIQPLIDAAGDQNPPKAKTPEDVAAIGLCIIESCIKKNTDLYYVAMAIGVRSYSSMLQDTSDEVIRRYIHPLMDHIRVRLFDSKNAALEITESPDLLIRNTSDVFIVHGRADGPKEQVARFIQRLELNPIILHEQINRGRTIIEKFEDHAEVQFAVVVLSPDDVGRLATAEETAGTHRARQNVIFEMGYFIGRIGRDRVFPLRQGNVEIPSDYSGIAYTEFDERGAWKGELVRELKAAGFIIDANKAYE